MAISEKTNLIVAAVQVDCQPLQVSTNLAHAAQFVEEAAQQGAQLVLLPELLPSGYLLTEEIWESAEPVNGPCTAWLTGLARRLHIYLGMTYLEAEGEDFYNAFVLSAPDGITTWRVRKAPPASLEAYFYRAGQNTHVLDTPLGRIGVGICYENLRFDTLQAFYRGSVDLVLQPMAAGRPLPYKPGDIELFDQMIENCAPHYAISLGAPVVLANRTGEIHTALPGTYPPFNSSFPGLSAIVDGDGSLLGRLGAEEGFLLGEVQLGLDRKPEHKPRRYHKEWALHVPWYAGMWPQTQHEGELAYAQNERRRQRALAISHSEAISMLESPG
jgi:N-carbamoylputrescine amidase